MFSEFRVVTLGLVFCWLLGSRELAVAQEVIDVQYRLKAERLYMLAALIQPPKGLAAGEEAVVVGVLGKDPFSGVDETGRQVNHLDEEVKRSKAKASRKPMVVKRVASAKDIPHCHILFISAEAAADSDEKTVDERLAAALKKTAGSAVLTVGDTKGLADKGAVINFYLTSDAAGVPKVAFEFNPDAARRAGLTKVNAGVYNLAKIVRGE